MSFYVPKDDSWTSVSDEPSPPYIRVHDDAPEVTFVGGPDATFRLEGATPEPGVGTTHTVATTDTDLHAGSVLCVLHARENDIDLDDRRSAGGPSRVGEDAFEHFRAALDEILIPVYLDDAVETLSEDVEGLVALHTAQYDDRVEGQCTYFRTSVFENGPLLLEEERGSL
jgi:hypothetical protein